MGRMDAVRALVRDALVMVRSGLDVAPAEPASEPPAPLTVAEATVAEMVPRPFVPPEELVADDVRIDPFRVLHLMSIGEEMALYDLRVVEEVVRTGTAEGAVPTSVAALEQDLDGIPRDRDVLLLCEDGQTATSLALRLRAAGVAAAWAVDGGLDGWARAGGPMAGVPAGEA